jgi:hypothetical protein
MAAIFAAGLASGAVLGGLHVAGAQSFSPSPSPAPGLLRPGHGWFGPGRVGGVLGGRFGLGLGSRFGLGLLHGEFTVRGPGGSYRTVAVQGGRVTSVGPSSISVRSDDGYTQAYVVGQDTVVVAGNNGIGDVHAGDTVRVLGVGQGGADRAVTILDLTTLQRARGAWLGS